MSEDTQSEQMGTERTVEFMFGSVRHRFFFTTGRMMLPLAITKRNIKAKVSGGYGSRALKPAFWVKVPTTTGPVARLVPRDQAYQLEQPGVEPMVAIDIDYLEIGGELKRGKKGYSSTNTVTFVIDYDGNAYPILHGGHQYGVDVSKTFALTESVKAIDLIGEELCKKFLKKEINSIV